MAAAAPHLPGSVIAYALLDPTRSWRPSLWQKLWSSSSAQLLFFLSPGPTPGGAGTDSTSSSSALTWPMQTQRLQLGHPVGGSAAGPLHTAAPAAGLWDASLPQPLHQALAQLQSSLLALAHGPTPQPHTLPPASATAPSHPSMQRLQPAASDPNISSFSTMCGPRSCVGQQVCQDLTLLLSRCMPSTTSSLALRRPPQTCASTGQQLTLSAAQASPQRLAPLLVNACSLLAALVRLQGATLWGADAGHPSDGKDSAGSGAQVSGGQLAASAAPGSGSGLTAAAQQLSQRARAMREARAARSALLQRYCDTSGPVSNASSNASGGASGGGSGGISEAKPEADCHSGPVKLRAGAAPGDVLPLGPLCLQLVSQLHVSFPWQDDITCALGELLLAALEAIATEGAAGVSRGMESCWGMHAAVCLHLGPCRARLHCSAPTQRLQLLVLKSAR